MKLINQSPYETRALRRCVVAAHKWMTHEGRLPSGIFNHAAEKVWWTRLRVYIITAGSQISVTTRDAVVLRVPRLTGDEWHQIQRQEANGALTPLDVFRKAVNDVWGLSLNADAGRFLARVQKHVGLVMPLRVVKPEPVKDQLTERYQRVLELESHWLRKQKLAATKVKSYRVKRRYYEKKLAARKETV